MWEMSITSAPVIDLWGTLDGCPSQAAGASDAHTLPSVARAAPRTAVRP